MRRRCCFSTDVADRKRMHGNYWHPIAVVGIANERAHDEKGEGGFGRPSARSEALRERWHLDVPSPSEHLLLRVLVLATFTRASAER
jgi:hypothetical protein